MNEWRLAVGVDLVHTARVQRLLEGAPDALEEVLTARERAYCVWRRRFHEHVAVRFAAKEAVLKALGSGLAAGMRWTDVEVTKEPGGRPGVRLHGEVAAAARRRGVQSLELSLSHSDGLAIAHAVAVLGPADGYQRGRPALTAA